MMIWEHLNDLPVVDAENKLIGELINMELFIKGKYLFDRERTDPGAKER